MGSIFNWICSNGNRLYFGLPATTIIMAQGATFGTGLKLYLNIKKETEEWKKHHRKEPMYFIWRLSKKKKF